MMSRHYEDLCDYGEWTLSNHSGCFILVGGAQFLLADMIQGTTIAANLLCIRLSGSTGTRTRELEDSLLRAQLRAHHEIMGSCSGVQQYFNNIQKVLLRKMWTREGIHSSWKGYSVGAPTLRGCHMNEQVICTEASSFQMSVHMQRERERQREKGKSNRTMRRPDLPCTVILPQFEASKCLRTYTKVEKSLPNYKCYALVAFPIQWYCFPPFSLDSSLSGLRLSVFA